MNKLNQQWHNNMNLSTPALSMENVKTHFSRRWLQQARILKGPAFFDNKDNIMDAAGMTNSSSAYELESFLKKIKTYQLEWETEKFDMYPISGVKRDFTKCL